MFLQNKKFIPYNNKLNLRARKLRNYQTAAEKKLWLEYLRYNQFRFIRQKVIGNYILDFYCQRLRLGIEIDGDSHLGAENEEYDKARAKRLEKFGVKVLRFWNEDVLICFFILPFLVASPWATFVFVNFSTCLHQPNYKFSL